MSPDGNEVVRVHVKPRMTLFTPHNSGCPVPTGDLTKRRETKVNGFEHDTAEENLLDDWTDAERAHMKLPGFWTGETSFTKRDITSVAGASSSSTGSSARGSNTGAAFGVAPFGAAQGEEEARMIAALARGADVTEIFSPKRIA